MLGGIEDQTLFSQNVRKSLGNTKVNKDITKSVSEKSRHNRFPLFHNGITMIAESISNQDGAITVSNYVVVNGAQSLSTLYKNEKLLSKDLRINVRAIELSGKPELAREITHNSNNQNAIRARDLKANNNIQMRLQVEVKNFSDGLYGFSIKRGEEISANEVIVNEEAAALFLAMDLQKPWTAHQRYKFFDESYGEIFGRTEVNAMRIIFLYEIGKYVSEQMTEVEYEQMARYKLTYYFILYCLSAVIRLDNDSRDIFNNPELIFEYNDYADLLSESIDELVSDIITDLNYEVKQLGDDFDYKADLKSPKRVVILGDSIVKEYEKQMKKGKAQTFADHLKIAMSKRDKG